MTAAARNFVLFKTDLFVFFQDDKDIDRWFVGGDCAGWFYARLLPVDCLKPWLEPVMEDWGWTFGVAVGEIKVWISVWAYLEENCWLFGLEPKKRLFRKVPKKELQLAKDTVAAALDEIIAHDLRIVKHRWFAENPFDLDVKSW